MTPAKLQLIVPVQIGKNEYAKLLVVVQAYALIATGVRMICSNQACVVTRESTLPASCSAM